MSIPPKDLANSNLFKPIKLGSVELKNRLVYAPTTRFRNTKDFVATDSMLEYYTRRAINNGGLLIVEATFPSLEFGLYENAPCIKTPEQVKAFKKIVDSVHSKGSSIAVQLWNLGRTADPKLLKKYNLPFVAPSPIYFDKNSEITAKEAKNELRSLTIPEIKNMIIEYSNAAKRSVNEAGFDIVEIHGAHMYLLDQFLQESSNNRTDEYGGSIENRARFLFEIIDGCIEAVGADHLGVRLSPYTEFNGGLGIKSEINPIVLWGYILSELQKRANSGNELAYISLVEPRLQGDDWEIDEKTSKINFEWPRYIWKGIIIRAGAFLDEKVIDKLEESINSDNKLLIGVSRPFTSNPDLVNRLKNGYPLTKYDRSKFYNIMQNDGYITFGSYGEEDDHSKDDVVPKPLA